MGRVALGLWCAFVVAVLVVLLVLGRFLTLAVAGGVGVLLTLLYAFTLSWMGKEAAPEQEQPDAWLPPADGRRPTARFDLDVETERLGDYGTHAWLFAVLLGVGVEAAITTAGVLPAVEKIPAGGGGVALGLVLVAAAVGILCFVDGAIEWRKRHAAVEADGWRPAEALVFTPSQRYDNSKVSIRFRDHSRILLHRRSSTHGISRRATAASQEVWVGGAGRFMVVLFPPDESDPWPYAVPVAGYEPRVTG
jgi:hypothetical protein